MQKELPPELETVEATIKLAILPFVISVTMTVAEYLTMLKTREYKGQEVSGILMQTVGDNEVWSDRIGRVIVNPLLTGVESGEYADPNSGD